MADEKTVRSTEKKAVASQKAKDANPSFLTKVINFFKRLPTAIVSPFKNMWRELKKVTWPSRKDLLQYTLVVLAFMTFMGVVIGLLDLGAARLIALLVGA
ncbi:MAG: preprotein translocase subunit SecE [Syntrophotalea acetylenica]|nr:preprotein translocase subunit SecE [Syntrophotalea acetylenica]